MDGWIVGWLGGCDRCDGIGWDVFFCALEEIRNIPHSQFLFHLDWGLAGRDERAIASMTVGQASKLLPSLFKPMFKDRNSPGPA